MSRIEEIMSQDKDRKSLLEKGEELVEYFKEQLTGYTYTALYDGYKRMAISEKFNDEYPNVPERYKTALKTAIRELMGKKVKEMDPSSPELLEFNKYIEAEIKDAQLIIDETKAFVEEEKEAKAKAMAKLKPDDNYKRFVTSYNEGNISPEGETLLNSEINKVKYNKAVFTQDLAEEAKKGIKK